jgi:hypothetical protein
MTYDELLNKNGKFVFVYLEPFDKWAKMKVEVMTSVIADEQCELHEGKKVVTLESKDYMIDIDSPDDLASYKIKEKL